MDHKTKTTKFPNGTIRMERSNSHHIPSIDSKIIRDMKVIVEVRPMDEQEEYGFYNFLREEIFPE